MAAYLISDGEVTDPALFAEFTDRIVPVMEAHNGKYLARGGETQVIGRQLDASPRGHHRTRKHGAGTSSARVPRVYRTRGDS